MAVRKRWCDGVPIIYRLHALAGSRSCALWLCVRCV